MKIDFDFPVEYKYDMPIFTSFKKIDECRSEGRITERVSSGLENVLSVYNHIAQKLSDSKEQDIKDYIIKKAYVVGSGARCNKATSDIDFVLKAANIDRESKKKLKYILAVMFYTNRSKRLAIDVYFERPLRTYVDITNQVKDLLDKYNNQLLNQKKK